MQSITIRSSTKEISRWQILVKNLPINLHNFCWKYLVSSLANRTNLKRWKILGKNNCELCNCSETQLHIFNNCKLALGRYEWRHNSVISIIRKHLKTKVTNDLLQPYSKGVTKLLKPTWMTTSDTEPDRHCPEKQQSNHCNKTYLRNFH